jgi:hypothetical protein
MAAELEAWRYMKDHPSKSTKGEAPVLEARRSKLEAKANSTNQAAGNTAGWKPALRKCLPFAKSAKDGARELNPCRPPFAEDYNLSGRQT